MSDVLHGTGSTISVLYAGLSAFPQIIINVLVKHGEYSVIFKKIHFIVSAKECSLKLLDYPKEIVYFAFLNNLKYRLTCTFSSTCQKIRLLYEFNTNNRDTTFRSVHSDHYRNNLRLSFKTEISSVGNKHSITLTIDPFTPLYGGLYRCSIIDAKNSRKVAKTFFVDG